jgi:drug/metabolite transporter (DMT)-like permease
MNSSSSSLSLRTGLALAVLSSAAFGTSGAFARSLINAGWTPAAVVAVRVTLASLILLVPTIISLRGRRDVLRRKSWFIISYGLFAVAGAQLLYFSAVQRIPVGVALLLEYLGTILVVSWMWFRHGQRPRRLTVIGSALALSGLVLVINPSAGVALDPVGILFGLGAAVGLATYFVLSADGDESLPPVALAGLGLGVAAITVWTAGAIGLVPFAANLGPVRFGGREVSWLIPILGLSIVAAAIAYLLAIAAARALGAKLASFVGLTEVLFATFFAWLFLGELPSSAQLGGGLLIVAGVVFVHVDEMKGAKASPAPVPAQEKAGIDAETPLAA